MSPITVALLLSLKVAFWATLITLLFGIGFGFLLSRMKSNIKIVIDTLFTMPMILPPTVIGYYLLIAFGSNSVLGQWLKSTFHFSFVFTLNGAILAAAIVSFPLVFKPAYTAFESVNSDFEQAAKGLGLSNWAVFCIVSLPLAWRAILAGALLGFARSLGEFGATLMIAGSIEGKTQTLSIAIWEAVQAGQDDLAQYLVMIISVVSICILVSVNFLNRKQKDRMGG